METSLDLPPDLVREMSLHAPREERNLRDLAADLLQAGLADPGKPKRPRFCLARIEIRATSNVIF